MEARASSTRTFCCRGAERAAPPCRYHSCKLSLGARCCCCNAVAVSCCKIAAAAGRVDHCFLRRRGSAAVPRSHSSLLEEAAAARRQAGRRRLIVDPRARAAVEAHTAHELHLLLQFPSTSSTGQSLGRTRPHGGLGLLNQPLALQELIGVVACSGVWRQEWQLVSSLLDPPESAGGRRASCSSAALRCASKRGAHRRRRGRGRPGCRGR